MSELLARLQSELNASRKAQAAKQAYDAAAQEAKAATAALDDAKAKHANWPPQILAAKNRIPWAFGLWKDDKIEKFLRDRPQ